MNAASWRSPWFLIDAYGERSLPWVPRWLWVVGLVGGVFLEIFEELAGLGAYEAVHVGVEGSG